MLILLDAKNDYKNETVQWRIKRQNVNYDGK